MLDLDEMKQKWAEQDKKLDESLRLNRQVLSAVNLNGARSALQRMIAFLALEAAAWFAAIVTVGGFIYGQAGTPHFALAGIAVDLFAVGMLAATLGQIVMARRVEYSQPVAAIQKQLEGLRVLRIRIIQWALAVGAVVWAPFAIVVCRTLFRIADYSQAWLWANVLFGLSLIPLAIWLSKRFAERMGPSPLLRRLLRDIAGYNLTAAGESLAELSRFEHETQTE
jgi:hypothetical protein